MKQLLIILFSLLAVTGFAANPAYTDFRGTNEVLVTTNPSTGRIIIGPAQPISTQINAAQVWTNANGTVYIPTAPTNALFITTNRSLFVGLGAWRQYFPTPPTYADGGVYVLHQADLPENTTRSSINVESIDSDSYHIDNYAFMEANTNDVDLFLSGPSQSTFEVWLSDPPAANPVSLILSNSYVFTINQAGLLSAYNGVATLLHNTSTNTLITVGSSPFNFTNTASQTIVVDLDANGATTAVKRNGAQIYGSLVGGDHEMLLKPGGYLTITYSLGTPVMGWTEL